MGKVTGGSAMRSRLLVFFFFRFLSPTGYFLSRKKVTKERFKKRGISISPFFLFRLFYFASGGLLLSVATKVTKNAI